MHRSRLLARPEEYLLKAYPFTLLPNHSDSKNGRSLLFSSWQFCYILQNYSRICSKVILTSFLSLSVYVQSKHRPITCILSHPHHATQIIEPLFSTHVKTGNCKESRCRSPKKLWKHMKTKRGWRWKGLHGKCKLRKKRKRENSNYYYYMPKTLIQQRWLNCFVPAIL